MDKRSVHQRSPKQARARKNPIKVVYISNPMRVKATASEFKGVVQELTGRDSDVADLSKFADVEEGPVAAGQVSGCTDRDVAGNSVGSGEHDDLPQPRRRRQQRQQQERDLYSSVENPIDMFDEVFTPQVVEDLAACMPSSLHHEYPPAVDNIRRWGGC